MTMLLYQCLDLVDEQYARIKPKSQDNTSYSNYNESCFLGLIFETTLSDYEMDVYAYVSNTRYKYFLIKVEDHATQVQLGKIMGSQASVQNAAQSAQVQKLNQDIVLKGKEVRNFLQQLHYLHANTLLNPFFSADYCDKNDG